MAGFAAGIRPLERNSALRLVVYPKASTGRWRMRVRQTIAICTALLLGCATDALAQSGGGAGGGGAGAAGSAGTGAGGSAAGATAPPGSIGTPATGGGSGTIGGTTPAPGVTGTTPSGSAATRPLDANGHPYRSIMGAESGTRCGVRGSTSANNGATGTNGKTPSGTVGAGTNAAVTGGAAGGC